MPKLSAASADIQPYERRWARIGAIAGASLMVLGALAILLMGGALVMVARRGQAVHPDSVLGPVFVGVPFLAYGALVRATARAMRRGAPHRWTAQAMVLLMPVILAGFVLLSLL